MTYNTTANQLRCTVQGFVLFLIMLSYVDSNLTQSRAKYCCIISSKLLNYAFFVLFCLVLGLVFGLLFLQLFNEIKW